MANMPDVTERPHLDVLNADTFHNVEPHAKPGHPEPMTRQDAMHGLDPELGHDLVQPTLGGDLLLRQ